MNLSLAKLKINPIIGKDTREALDNASHTYNIFDSVGFFMLIHILYTTFRFNTELEKTHKTGTGH
jgi:hypothetical protein